MKLKLLFIVTLSLLVLSVLTNYLLFRLCNDYYRELQIVRLDPLSSGKFSKDNLQLRNSSAKKNNVILLGDSRIARWSPALSPAEGEIINRGVAGETSNITLLRLEQDVFSLHPAGVVIQTGINDLKTIGLWPERKEAIVSICKRNLQQIAEKLSAHNIPVCFLTIFPPAEVDWKHYVVWSDDIRSAVVEVNQYLKNMNLKNIQVIDCSVLLESDKYLKQEYAQDTYHLNAAGYKALNSCLADRVNKFISAP